jgi:hypothetical protein
MIPEHIFRFFLLTRVSTEPKMRPQPGSKSNRLQEIGPLFGSDKIEVREVMGSREGRNLKRVVSQHSLNCYEEISMKKTLLTCMAVLALFAIASSATAIVCTIDQRPAATLLVPYFSVAVNSDGTYPTSSPTTAANTFVTITNASSSPMLAHVSIYNKRSELALDFNVALTGFDVQSMDIGSILQGNIPATPSPTVPNVFPPGSNPVSHTRASGLSDDPCFRNPASVVFPAIKGYARIKPVAFADPANDPAFATTVYPQPAYIVGSTFWQGVIGTLDGTPGSRTCPGGILPPYTSPLEGYIVIDHVNYCTLANPDNAPYYSSDAIGMENNLMGEVIFVSGAGLPTFGGSTVNVEASRLFSDDTNGASGGGYFTQTAASRERTFYARYWSPTTETFVNPVNAAGFASNPWNQGFGDEREPLGLRFAVRYFEGNGVQSYLRVWRASSGTLTNLLGSSCTTDEESIVLVIFDEDENPAVSASQPPCPSPPINCSAPPPYNFPKETQRIRSNLLPPLPPAFGGAQVGWLEASFVNTTIPGNNNGLLDQAWMDYEFQGAAAFTNASIPGTQLDPTTCQPLLVPLVGPGTVTTLIVPSIPLGWVPGGADGLTPNPPAGTGP